MVNLIFRSLVSCFLVIMAFPMMGCSTLSRGFKQDVTIVTFPEGAVVSLDGEGEWTTPATIPVSRKRDHAITIQKPGYLEETIELKREADAGSFLAILLPGGSISLAIDAATGAGYKLVPEAVDVELKRENAWIGGLCYTLYSTMKNWVFTNESVMDNQVQSS